MVKIFFTPDGKSIEVDKGTKLLVAGRKAQTQIRFGCASCRCGTCGVRVDTKNGELSPLKPEERDLLTKMALPVDGTIRLACQARAVFGEVVIDLNFQNQYDPGQGQTDFDL